MVTLGRQSRMASIAVRRMEHSPRCSRKNSSCRLLSEGHPAKRKKRIAPGIRGLPRVHLPNSEQKSNCLTAPLLRVPWSNRQTANAWSRRRARKGTTHLARSTRLEGLIKERLGRIRNQKLTLYITEQLDLQTLETDDKICLFPFAHSANSMARMKTRCNCV